MAANGLTVSPPLKEITLGPGLLETTTEVTLQNNTNQPISAHLQLIDLKALGDFGGNSIDKANLSDSYNLANWMELAGSDTVDIQSGKTSTATVKINNKSDLTPGGHYGALIITSASGTGVKSEINITQQLVSLIFVKKLGGEKYGLELKGIDKKGADIPQELTTTFKSTGNVHVIPRGYIEIRDPSNTLIAKGILNEDSNMILPGNERRFVTLLQPVSAAKKAGKYKITVFYRYDGQDDFKSYSTYFNHGNRMLTYILRGVIIAVPILAVGAVVLIRRRKRRGLNSLRLRR